MRTHIDIDDELMAEAMTASGLPTKQATVVAGLRLLIRLSGQVEGLSELDGLGWDGDLDSSRGDRLPRRVIPAGKLTDAELALIAAAEVPAEHAHLDDQLDSVRP